MPGFRREKSTLLCDDTPLEAIARAVGTPVHVYSGAAIDDRYRRLAAAFAGYRCHLHYALKANSTIAIAARLRSLGAGADANSGGELEVALRAGFRPDDIVFTGVGKTRAELARAVDLDVAAINIESAGEAARLSAIAREAGRRVRVAVRVNPDVEAGSHPHISTGSRATKFGIPAIDALDVLRAASRDPHLATAGVHVHVGSQITSAEPIRRAATLVADLARRAADEGIALQHLDLGGGLGVAYEPGQTTLSVEEYAAALLPIVAPTGLSLLLEPGRWILAPAGVLLTEVVDLKPKPGGGTFVVTDAGMTDLLRPALYGAWHRIEPVVERAGPPIVADVVGPVCETSDTLGRDRTLPPIEVGDLLAIRDTGAYGAVMASNYNRRLNAAEVLVDDAAWRVIRRRQTIDDLLQWDEPC